MLRNRLHFLVSDGIRFPDGVFIDIIITQWKWCHTHSFVTAALETASFLRWRNRNWSHFQILFNLTKQINQKTITLFCEIYFVFNYWLQFRSKYMQNAAVGLTSSVCVRPLAKYSRCTEVKLHCSCPAEKTGKYKWLKRGPLLSPC